jgi:hypothetical protein
MKRSIVVLAGLAALAAVAPAQTSKPIGLSVRAGLLWPTSGFGRDQGRTWFGIGAEFKIKDSTFGVNDRASSGMLTISADYYGKGAANSVPVLLNYVGMKNEIYYSLGAGFAFNRDEVISAGVASSRNKTDFAYGLGLGYNFQHGQNPLFVELRYFGSGNSNLNAFGAYIGVRL